MNQNFTTKELKKFLSSGDIKKISSLLDFDEKLEEAVSKIMDYSYEFDIQRKGKIFYCSNIIDILILRKLNDNIKRIYKDEQANRRVIMSQVSTLLKENCPFWIFRTDIAKFYESIDRNKILDKFKNDALLSYFSIWLIDRIFKNNLISASTGLPRGIGISSTLSEIYMRKFDQQIRGYSGVYYYSRFVDDILIFNNNEVFIEQLKLNIQDYLEDGLKINIKKTELYDGSKISTKKKLEYLGYQFLIKTESKTKKTVTIKISDEKIKKIKSRLVLSFARYSNDGDLQMLENRIKFLTGNFSIKRKAGSNTDLKAGIYYNYIHINNFDQLVELNNFYHKLINSKCGSLGLKLCSKITIPIKVKLDKYSFRQGFINKIYHKFSSMDIQKIKEVWHHE